MEKFTKYSFQFVLFALVLLWSYAAVSKLMDFRLYMATMHRQPLFPWVKHYIIYVLPPAEIVTALLLLFDRARRAGLFLSFTLLFAFTVYIGLALSGAFGHIPCSCGGILTKMSWKTHFIFNIFYLLLTAFGITIDNRERRRIQTG